METSKKILVTGGAGFLGTLLLEELLAKNFHCVSIDIKPHSITHANLSAVIADISDKKSLEKIFAAHSFHAILHCAAVLAHGKYSKQNLWDSNVTATEYLVELAKQYHVPKIIFTSSNCLWARNFNRAVLETDTPEPIEIYGKSKLAAENILLANKKDLTTIIFRCPTIIDAGRMGLLAILFEFIREGRKVYLVGHGKNQYQFIYAKDLVDAMIKSLSYHESAVFNIGSDNVKSLHDTFKFVIDKAHTKSRLVALPKKFTLAMMKLAYRLRLSPLGPYHYKMIAEDFIFDTQKIRRELAWQPTLTNEEMLWKGYQYYEENLPNLKDRTKLSAHKQPAKMGIIRLLKWLS